MGVDHPDSYRSPDHGYGQSKSLTLTSNIEERILQRLRLEAFDVAQNEPEIAGYIFYAIMKHQTLASVVIQRLASRLGHADLPRDLIRQTFSRLVAEDESLPTAIVSDLIATVDRDPACRRFLEPILHFKGFHAIQTHRFAHALWRHGRQELSRYLQSRTSSIFQVDIHPSVRIGSGVLLDHATGLVVSAGVVIEDDVSILHNVSIGQDEKIGGSIIRRGTSLGAGSKIAGGLEVGPCARVAAGSVVLESVPTNRTVAGSPARIVAMTDCPEQTRTFDDLLKTKLRLMHDKDHAHIL